MSFDNTLKLINKYNDCKKKITPSIDDTEFIHFFNIQLAQSLIQDTGEGAIKLAKIILAAVE